MYIANRHHLYFILTSKCVLFQVSRRMERTMGTSFLGRLWTPAHSMQTNTPRDTDTHSTGHSRVSEWSHIDKNAQKLINSINFTDVTAVGAYLVFFRFRLDLQHLFSHFFTSRCHRTHVNGLHTARFAVQFTKLSIICCNHGRFIFSSRARRSHFARDRSAECSACTCSMSFHIQYSLIRFEKAMKEQGRCITLNV